MAKARTKRATADTAAGPTPEERARLDAEAEEALAEQDREETDAEPYADPTAPQMAWAIVPNRGEEAAEPEMLPGAAAVEAFVAEGGTQAFVTRVPGASEQDPEALLVVCNSCRSTAWNVGKASATAISLTCSR